MAHAKHSESNDSAQVPDLSIVSSPALALCCRGEDEERVGSSVESLRSVRHRYTGECGPSPWGGSRGVVALKETTVESRSPVSRVGPSGGRETF